jgi:hypothetical protein
VRAAAVFDPSPVLGADRIGIEDVKHPREGDESLTGSSKIGSRGTGDRNKPRKRVARRKAGDANDVGRALRSVYDTTLREDVPKDFLDLLGKLD